LAAFTTPNGFRYTPVPEFVGVAKPIIS